MNKTTKTTIAGATTAILIAGGATVYSLLDDKSSLVTPIDWSQYELNVPKLDVPYISLPNISVNLDVPSINIESTSSSLTVPSIGNFNNDSNYASLDKETQNNIPSVLVPNVSGTELNVQYIVTPEVMANLNIQNIQIDNNLIKNLNINHIKIEDLDTHDNDFPEWISFIKDVNKLFVDKRTINYDPTILKTNKVINDWMKIYKEYEKIPTVSYVAIKKPFKMISQVLVPKNNEQLNLLTKNLAYYKSQGYDSVLVVFTKDDSYYNVLNTIKYIKKYCDMNVWLSYGGEQSLKVSVFMDVEKYTMILQQCAPYISGYVNSWRRTSSHLWQQDFAFMNYTNHILRKYNSNLPIIGELYYGNNHKYDTVDNIGFILNNFKNSSGIMIVNFGFKRIDIKYLMNKVLKPYLKNSAKIALVVGQRPYYMTVNNNKLDYKKNMKIKHQIENEFLKNGCVGTITLSNDGREMNTNNISETPFEKLQGF